MTGPSGTSAFGQSDISLYLLNVHSTYIGLTNSGGLNEYVRKYDCRVRTRFFFAGENDPKQTGGPNFMHTNFFLARGQLKHCLFIYRFLPSPSPGRIATGRRNRNSPLASRRLTPIPDRCPPPHTHSPFPIEKKGPSPSPIFAPKAHLSRPHCSPAVGVDRRDIIHPSAAAAAAAEEEEEEEPGGRRQGRK